MKFKKVIAIIMAAVCFYWVGVTGILSVAKENKTPVCILDAEITEINEYEAKLIVDVFGEEHIYILRNDSLPEFKEGDNLLVAMEMHHQEYPETWEIRGIR